MIKEIPGFNGYYASDSGDIYGKTGIKLKDIIKSGYCYVRVAGKLIRKHRLIAITFIPNPNNLPEVNHKDCNTSHNWTSNLEWCTRSENVQHQFNTGGLTSEHMSNIAKLSSGGKINAKLHGKCVEQCDFDGNIIAIFDNIKEASRKTGVTPSGISRCCNGEYTQYKGYKWRYHNE